MDAGTFKKVLSTNGEFDTEQERQDILKMAISNLSMVASAQAICLTMLSSSDKTDTDDFVRAAEVAESVSTSLKNFLEVYQMLYEDNPLIQEKSDN